MASTSVTPSTPRASLYDRYYSASDVTVFIYEKNTNNKLWLDKASGIALNESLSSAPIYTLGNSRFHFLTKGNVITSGILTVNINDPHYLGKVMTHITTPPRFKRLSPEEQISLSYYSLQEYKLAERKYLKSVTYADGILGMSDYPLVNIELVYNNSDVTEYRESFTRTISDIRFTSYEEGISITSDGQLVNGFRFVARTTN